MQPEDQPWVSNFALFTSKIKKKNTLFIGQSAFGNFGLYVINYKLMHYHKDPDLPSNMKH